LGVTQARRGLYQEALTHFKRAAGLASACPLPQFSLGLTCLNLGKHTEALRHFQRAIEFEQRRQSELSQAARSVSAELDLPKCWFYLALTYQKLGQQQSAKKCLDNALRLGFHHPELIEQLYLPVPEKSQSE
jgi:tetratricopeptide (TPR) repeat protein